MHILTFVTGSFSPHFLFFVLIFFYTWIHNEAKFYKLTDKLFRREQCSGARTRALYDSALLFAFLRSIFVINYYVTHRVLRVYKIILNDAQNNLSEIRVVIHSPDFSRAHV